MLLTTSSSPALAPVCCFFFFAELFLLNRSGSPIGDGAHPGGGLATPRPVLPIDYRFWVPHSARLEDVAFGAATEADRSF